VRNTLADKGVVDSAEDPSEGLAQSFAALRCKVVRTLFEDVSGTACTKMALAAVTIEYRNQHEVCAQADHKLDILVRPSWKKLLAATV
jgi:hypothetical protein